MGESSEGERFMHRALLELSIVSVNFAAIIDKLFIAAVPLVCSLFGIINNMRDCILFI